MPREALSPGGSRGQAQRGARAAAGPGGWTRRPRFCRLVDEHFPNQPDVANLQGLIAQARGDFGEAAALFKRAVALEPREPAYLFHRALALRQLGRFDEALAAYHTAATLIPLSPEAHFNRSVALLDLDRAEEALAVCDTP